MSLPDLRDLGAVAPDSNPTDAAVILDVLERKRIEKGPRALAVDGARIRHSWAGECARALSYHITEEPETNPPDRPALLTFALGQQVHDWWQEGMIERGAEIEVKCQIPEIQSAGHIDAVLGDVAYEAKSINGFGFKQAMGASGKGEGPRASAVLQGALNAYAIGAKTLRVVYVSLEQISKNIAKKLPFTTNDQRMVAQWTFGEEEYATIAVKEVTRMRKVLDLVDAGEVVPRHIPGMPSGARITDPSKGTWQLVDGASTLLDIGGCWQCGYCSYQDRCIEDMRAEF